MSRKLLLVIAFAAAVGGGAVSADDEKKPPVAKEADKKADTDPPAKGKLAGKIDKAKMFEKMDADGDGKVTKTEFTKWADAAKEKLKTAGKGEKLGDLLGDKMFEKMDANKDGEVTKEEFEKFEFAGAAGGKLDAETLKKLKAKKKDGE